MANQIGDEMNKDEAFKNIAEIQASIDLEGALATVNLIQDPELNFQAFSTIAKGRALTAPDQALFIVSRIQDPVNRTIALLEIAKINAPANPQRSNEMYREAMESASLCTTLSSLIPIVEALTKT